MRNDSGTYFSHELSFDNPFYILNGGMAVDSMCDDILGVTRIEKHLHRHLKQHGFDVVVFFDNRSMLFTYDLRSSYALQNPRCTKGMLDRIPLRADTSASQGGAEAAEPSAAGPTSGFRRSRVHRSGQEQADPFRQTLNYGRLTSQAAGDTLKPLLENEAIRTALVFTSLTALRMCYSSVSELNERLYESFVEVRKNRSKNRNVVIFISESNNDIEGTLTSGSDTWRRFAYDILIPMLHDQEEDVSHFIQLPPPTEDEIRSLLTMYRLRDQMPLLIDMRYFDEISRRLALFCAKKNKRLDYLEHKLDKLCEAQHRQGAATASLSLIGIGEITGSTDLRSAREKLDSLIGMQALKDFVVEMHFNTAMDAAEPGERIEYRDRFTPPMAVHKVRGHGLNVALLGEPGTGKTRAAHILAEIYHEIGLLPTANVIERTASELMQGGNAEGVARAVEAARGGVLFVDEAYSLMDNEFGIAAINSLVNYLSRYSGQFALIIAGYKDDIEKLLEANDGLPGRIPNKIELEPYDDEQMLQIFRFMVEEDGNTQIDEALEEKLPDFFRGWVKDRGPYWANAREAEQLLDRMQKSFSRRTHDEQIKPQRYLLTEEDIPEELRTWLRPRSNDIEDVIRILNEEVIGLKNARDYLIELQRGIELGTIAREPGKYVFMGPPGTGKTMMAGRMAEILNAIGVLNRRTPVIYSAKQLLEPPRKGLKPGQRPDPNQNSLRQAIQEAKGSILVIDEAHQLADTPEGRDLIRDLVPIIDSEDFRSSTGLVLCGYITEMQKLFEVDSGLMSRFPQQSRVKFINYSAEDLTKILAVMMKKRGELADETPEEPKKTGFLTRSRAALSAFLSKPQENFGNARFIRDTYLPNACRVRNERLMRQYCSELQPGSALTKEMSSRIPENEKHLLTGADLPLDFRRLIGPVDSEPLPECTAEQLLSELYEKDEIKKFVTRMTAGFDAETAILNETDSTMHFTISGPLGSGRKTAVAAVANAFAEAGLIDSKEVFYYGKGDLEAGWVGQTAEKTRNQIVRAQGGTVVIVSPSTMLPNDHNDNTFGPEALNEVFSCMSVFGRNTCFVFMDSQQGMEAFKRVFPQAENLTSFELEDLSIGTMQQLLRKKTEHRFRFEDTVAALQDDFVANLVNDRGGVGDNVDSWNNGAALDKLLDELRSTWASRESREAVKDEQNYPVMIITRDMFPKRFMKYLREGNSVKQDALKELDDIIGLEGVKKRVRGIEARVCREQQENRENAMPGLYLFLGNPGVGKTMVAKLMGRALAAAGVLEHGYVIQRTAREMIQQTAHRPDRFKKLLRTARGNVLFIDEAHQLRQSEAGNDVVQQLLTALEDIEVTKKTCIILAGYPLEMMRLLEVDAGLGSRFGRESSRILFEDYSEDELIKLLIFMAEHPEKYPEIGLSCSVDLNTPENREFMEAARMLFRSVLATHDPNYGNARYVRSFLADAVQRQVERLDAAYPRDTLIPAEEYRRFVIEDVAEKNRRLINRKSIRVARIPMSALNTTGGEQIQ